MRPQRGGFDETTYFPAAQFGVAGKLLFLAMLTACMVFTLQKSQLRPAEIYRHAATLYSHAATSLQRLAVPAPAPTPSAFEQESLMTPRELLDRWDPLIAGAARRFGISKDWIRAVIRMESGGRTMLEENLPITSSAGAMGIMQVMPGTYREMRAQYKLGVDPYNPHDNVLAGTAYLKWLYRRYGYPAMFAAYNDGPGKLEDHLLRGRPLPAETRAYVDGVATMLNGRRRGALETAELTRPDGLPVVIDASAVAAIRAPLPGEFAPSVHAVLRLGKHSQAVQETIAAAAAIIKQHGGRA